jgi:acetoin utilization protein AcuB
MLLVKDSMSRDVATLAPDATAAEALALCREKRIRHLPIVQDGRLVGIVSDRDLRSATPTLGDPDRAAALQEIRVGDHMSRQAVTALPEDPIEQAAKQMREEGVGCLPVTEGEELVGILTTSDVVEAMMHLVGAYEPGSRLEVAMPEHPGALAEVAGVFRDHGAKVLSVLASSERDPRAGDPLGERIAVFRLETINPAGIVDALQAAGFVVRWPPASPKGHPPGPAGEERDT